MNDPLFSVITPTCGRPSLLQRAIRSVLSQTFRDFELIIVDDACDPETKQIVRLYADERISLIQHETSKGAAAAYNTGIKACRGRLISTLDDDDEYYPTFLERTNQFFQSAPSHIGFVWTGIRRVIDAPEGEVLWYEKVWPSVILPEEEAFLAATTIGNGFGLTVRRECVRTVGLYDETFSVCEDTEYLFRLARRFQFATIPEILVKIHRHGNGQLTHQKNDEVRLELYERLLRENTDFIEPHSKLFYVHFRCLAGMCYSLGAKPRARKILVTMWKKTRCRLSVFLDFVCFEWFGVDSETFWRQSRLKRRIDGLGRLARNLIPWAP